MNKESITYRMLVSVFVIILMSESAYAYLDPGTGSMILQGLIAAIAIGISTAKIWWYRFTSFFSKKDEDRENTTEV